MAFNSSNRLRKLALLIGIVVLLQFVVLTAGVLLPPLRSVTNYLLIPGTLIIAYVVHVGGAHGDIGPIAVAFAVNTVVYCILVLGLMTWLARKRIIKS